MKSFVINVVKWVTLPTSVPRVIWPFSVIINMSGTINEPTCKKNGFYSITVLYNFILVREMKFNFYVLNAIYLCVLEIATTSPVTGSLVISSESGSIRIKPPLRLSSDKMSLTRVSECKLGGFWAFPVGLTLRGACCCPKGSNCCWELKVGRNDWGCWLKEG